MLFADNEWGPWLLGLGSSAAAIFLTILRVWDYYKGKSLKWKSAAAQTDRDIEKGLSERQKEVRRDITTEAWSLNDRQTKIIEDLEKKVNDAIERERQCTEERAQEQAQHATVKMVLRLVVAWARGQKNPPPIPDDILRELFSEGSGAHMPLVVPQTGGGK